MHNVLLFPRKLHYDLYVMLDLLLSFAIVSGSILLVGLVVGLIIWLSIKIGG